MLPEILWTARPFIQMLLDAFRGTCMLSGSLLPFPLLATWNVLLLRLEVAHLLC